MVAEEHYVQVWMCTIYVSRMMIWQKVSWMNYLKDNFSCKVVDYQDSPILLLPNNNALHWHKRDLNIT